MRIAYICADPGVPVFGCKGCSIHVQEVLRAMTRIGADIDLFATRFEADPPRDLRGIRLHRLPALPRADLSLRERAALDANHDLQTALQRSGPFDLIYERYSLWSYAGMETARKGTIPGLLEVNAPLIEEQATYRGLHDRSAAESVARRAFAAASRLIAVSKPVADYLKSFDRMGGKVAVVPNGVDVQRFSPTRRATYPAAPGVTTIGFVGTLKPWHGVNDLIAAVDQLVQQGHSIRLLIAGDGPEASALREDVHARRLEEIVQFTGQVYPDEMSGLLCSIDIAVAPYPSQTNFYFSPLKLFEYMAAGRAIVASRIGQMTEILEDGVTGLFSEPGNVGDLASVIGRLIDDPSLRQRLGRMARVAAVRHHSWVMTVRRIFELAGLASKCRERVVQ